MFTFLQIMPKIVHFGEFLKAFCETVLPEKPIQKRPKNVEKLIRFARSAFGLPCSALEKSR